MRHDAPASIRALLGSRVPGHGFPPAVYADPGLFDAELEIIFRRHWIFVGLACELPQPGSALALDVAGVGLLIVRGADGVLRGFVNACRHRGARLVAPGQATLRRILCPYHHWAYDLEGRLVAARQMGAGFDPRAHGLTPVHLRDVAGLLYAHIRDDPPADIDDLADAMTARLAPYRLDDAKVAHEEDVVEQANWKLVIENNRECYHCAASHPELCASFVTYDFGYDPASLTASQLAEAERHEARIAAATQEWEAGGHPSAAIEHLTGHPTHFRTQRLLMAGDGESQTRDGRAACTLKLGRLTRSDLGDVHLWGHNCWHHVMADHAVCFMIVPLSPTETLLRTKWIVHRDAVEGRDYTLDRLTEVWKATNRQDAALVALAQSGAASPVHVPGPYSPHTERQCEAFAAWYEQRMQAHLGASGSTPRLVARDDGRRAFA